jgi:hypothetical protein
MQPTLIIACAVLEDALRSQIGDANFAIQVMDYGLHLTPLKMTAAIQARIDSLAVPHNVLIGFGLCGNGLVGLESRAHTLIIPRVDDCISLFLGSRPAYLEAFRSEPGTYYLTRGWLECGGDPWSEYQKCLARFGPDKAAMISDALYRNYRKACLIAFTNQELDRCRPQALKVAAFCRERWGWRYEERLGSDRLIRRLLDIGRLGASAALDSHAGEFVVVPPNSQVQQNQFMLV